MLVASLVHSAAAWQGWHIHRMLHLSQQGSTTCLCHNKLFLAARTCTCFLVSASLCLPVGALGVQYACLLLCHEAQDLCACWLP